MNSPNNNLAIVICPSVVGFNPLPGSEIKQCHYCHKNIYLHYITKLRITESEITNEIKLACIPCGLIKITEMEDEIKLV